MTAHEEDHSDQEAEKVSGVEDSVSEAEKAESNTSSSDYRQKYEKMRAHSRTWETRAEKSLEEVKHLTAQLDSLKDENGKLEETVEALRSQLSEATSQLGEATRHNDLTTRIADLGGNIGQLFDSKRFCKAVDELDLDADDADSTLKTLIKQHSTATAPSSSLTWEQPGQGISKGEELWNRRKARRGA